MLRPILAAAALMMFVQSAAAQPELETDLSGLGFMLGHWSSGRGQVADTGGTSTGSSVIEPVVGGAALLRRDHTDLFDASGKPTGGFDQVMLIYPEGGVIHADYLDGSHVIHYTSAVIDPGKSVTFAADGPGPAFRLTYSSAGPANLDVAFSMAAPGSRDFHPIATGTLARAP